MMLKEPIKHSEETCEFCASRKDFEMPSPVMSALCNGNLVIFAGAGISTEKKNLFPFSLYELIASELGFEEGELTESFSRLMSRYVKDNINGRSKLIHKIRDRIEYVKSFSSLYHQATDFHKELADIYLINDIITTNWDDFFETECGAIPMVTPEDFAYWDIQSRKVFKIHGSINNIGSLVITEKDYKKCYRNLSKSPVGSYLKLALATKTVVFTGYSWGDEDFEKVYSLLKRDMKELLPHSYLVTLDERPLSKLRSTSITPVITDGAYFLHKIRTQLTDEGILIDNSVYDLIETILGYVRKCHEEMPAMKPFKISNNPNLVYTYMYQDGLIDAFERALRKRIDGDYLNPHYIIQQLQLYEEDIRKDAVKNRHYTDVSYIDGYIAGLSVFIRVWVKSVDKFKDEVVPDLPSPFYIYGYGTVEKLKEFEKLSKKIYHKSAYKSAQALIKRRKPPEGGVLHHSPFL